MVYFMLELGSGFVTFGQHHARLFTGTIRVLLKLNKGIASAMHLQFPGGLASIDIDTHRSLNRRAVNTEVKTQLDSFRVNRCPALAFHVESVWLPQPCD